MQNLRNLQFIRLAYLTMAIICANYGSILAQDEQKAFKEGDKILSIGVGLGNSIFNDSHNPDIHTSPTYSMSFDYGLKGTRGIVSIGAFASYSLSNYSVFSQGIVRTDGNFANIGNPQDSIYAVSSGLNLKQHTFMAGVRLGLHYSTKKWDFYAGTLVGYKTVFRESSSYLVSYFKEYPNSTSVPIKNDFTYFQSMNNGQFILSPYVGAKYYVTKKISLNIEAGQQTGSIGIGFKF